MTTIVNMVSMVRTLDVAETGAGAFTALSSTFVFVLLLSVVSDANAQQVLRGHVHDAATREDVINANVLVVGTTHGTVTDESGHFEMTLEAGAYTLRVSAIGYAAQSYAIQVGADELSPLHVALQPTIMLFDEVVINSDAEFVNDLAAPPRKLNATEDLLGRVPGAGFIQRANFAWEPVIRGMNGAQVGLVIDGVKVFGACVDKMDPTSAYVEVENLEKLELSKGGFDLNNASQIGGSVNLVTEKPRFDVPFHLSGETGYESVSTLRRARVVGGASYGNTAVRGSFSYKVADDFTPGGRDAIANSGYAKNNYKLDATQRLGGGHAVGASVLVDNAWDVGYPVLLMDATLASARIYSATHSWTPSSTGGWLRGLDTRVYHNTVDHWMDDFARDVSEREVMRAMNMPMFGKTRTSGFLSRAAMRFGIHNLGVTLDGYYTTAFGDMWMFSEFETIPDMYLLNLGDTVVRHGAVVADWQFPVSARANLRINGRIDHSPRDVESESARAVLEGRWETDELATTYSVPNLSATLEYAVNPTTRLRLSTATVGRLPSHVENYGHYVYNYVDGYFYTGNPGLKPERSRQVEVGVERYTARYAVRLGAYFNHIRNYIIGQDDGGFLSQSSTLRFRTYMNASAATLMGAELSGVVQVFRATELAASGSYTRGQNLDVDEPLPLIPPLSGLLSLRHTRQKFWGELEARAAMPQNRVSEIVAEEDGTDGYFVVNLRGAYQLPRGVEIKAGVENVFDYFYHEHLSFGNLPSRGRNLFMSVGFKIN